MKKSFTILTTLFISLFLFSCTTIKEVPADKSANQILQMGQNAYSSGSYSSAELCYKTTIDRFGSDPYILIQAKYELAHLYSTQKKYDKAKVIFNEILADYAANPTVIPPKYKKLSEMGLIQIAEETAPKTKKNKKK